MQYGMAIDTARCIGCTTCAVACRMANNQPNNVWWNRVLTDGGDAIDTMSGEYPNNKVTFYPLACQHCANPACTRACPVGATWKDEETGIVMQDPGKCIGCRMCMAACPYTGIRSFNWEEPTYYIDFPKGDIDAPSHEKHTVEKCIMCKGRVDRGERPACVDACPARARVWGDLDDPNSDVYKQISSREHKQLLTEKGTRPSIYYLV